MVRDRHRCVCGHAVLRLWFILIVRHSSSVSVVLISLVLSSIYGALSWECPFDSVPVNVRTDFFSPS